AWRSVSAAGAGAPPPPPPFLPGRHPRGFVPLAESAGVSSLPLARLAVVLRVLIPAPASARTGAVASDAAPFAARPIRRNALERPTRVAIASVATGSPASSFSPLLTKRRRTAARAGARSVVACIVTGLRPRLPPVKRTRRWTRRPSDQVRYAPSTGRLRAIA